jgi:hypothetical protein
MRKPDWANVGGKTIFFVVVAFFVALALFAWKGLGVAGLLLVLPLLAWFASRLIVHGSSGAVGLINRRATSEWEGYYYAFDDIQIRVYEDDGRLWFVARDVLKALGMKDVADSFLARFPDHARLLESEKLTVLDADGLEKLLGRRQDRESVRFLLWMRRDVLKPWAKKKENLSGVADGYRRSE